MNKLLLTIMLCWTTLFSSQCFAEKVLYEAELATLGGNAVIADDQEANNLAYVKMNEGSITFKANAKSNGIYTLTIHYKNDYGSSKTNDINVNGENVASLTFEISSSYKDIETTISLNAGENTIALTKFWGWIDVDYFALSEYQATPFNLSESPVTVDATEAAKEVYNFLLNNFEKKTISGIMTGNITASADLFSQEDLVAFKDAGGKYPALVGFDLLFATGKDSKELWNQEYTNATLKLAEELGEKAEYQPLLGTGKILVMPLSRSMLNLQQMAKHTLLSTSQQGLFRVLQNGTQILRLTNN